MEHDVLLVAVSEVLLVLRRLSLSSAATNLFRVWWQATEEGICHCDAEGKVGAILVEVSLVLLLAVMVAMTILLKNLKIDGSLSNTQSSSYTKRSLNTLFNDVMTLHERAPLLQHLRGMC